MSMTLDAPPLISMLLGAAGWIVTVVVSYRLGQRKSTEDRYWAAAASFRGAINVAISGIPRSVEPGNSDNAAQHFDSAHRALEVAVANFRPYVRVFNRPEFELAWIRLSSVCEGSAHEMERRQRQGLGLLLPEPYRDCRAEVVEKASAIVALAPEKRLLR